MADLTSQILGVVYVLKDPRDQAVRYVGQSINVESRFRSHIANQNQGNLAKRDWGRDLERLGLKPETEIVESEIPFENIFEREKFWIQHFAANGAKLLNLPVGATARTDLVSAVEWQSAADTIGSIRAAIFHLLEALRGKTPIRCDGINALGVAEKKLLIAKLYFQDLEDTAIARMQKPEGPKS